MFLAEYTVLAAQYPNMAAVVLLSAAQAYDRSSGLGSCISKHYSMSSRIEYQYKVSVQAKNSSSSVRVSVSVMHLRSVFSIQRAMLSRQETFQTRHVGQHVNPFVYYTCGLCAYAYTSLKQGTSVIVCL